MNATKFWLDDPKSLFNSLDVIPNDAMTIPEKLNALTRLLIIVTIGLYIVGYTQAPYILLFGLLLIIAVRCYKSREEFSLTPVSNKQALDHGIRQYVPGYDSRPHEPPNNACWFDQNTDLLNAALEVTPPIQFNHDDAAKRSYTNAKYELTPLEDTNGFKEIWRSEPGMCGEFTMTSDPRVEFPVEADMSPGQCNYIVRSKIDHLPVSEAQNGLISTRAMAEQGYLDSVMSFRDGIMNEHIDRFNRERKHNCPDMKLLTTSAGGGGSI